MNSAEETRQERESARTYPSTNVEITQEREGSRVYATPNVQHVSIGGPIRGILYWPIVIILTFSVCLRQTNF
jgi:hypothetical protein